MFKWTASNESSLLNLGTVNPSTSPLVEEEAKQHSSVNNSETKSINSSDNNMFDSNESDLQSHSLENELIQAHITIETLQNQLEYAMQRIQNLELENHSLELMLREERGGRPGNSGIPNIHNVEDTSDITSTK